MYSSGAPSEARPISCRKRGRKVTEAEWLKRSGFRAKWTWLSQGYSRSTPTGIAEAVAECAHLRELSEAGVTEQRHMAEQLVTDVWLRCVHGPGAVADVLGGVEHAEGKTSEKVARRKKPYKVVYNHEEIGKTTAC